MKEQLDRIEEKLDAYAQQTAKNTTDIVWLKKLFGTIGTALSAFVAALLRKHGL